MLLLRGIYHVTQGQRRRPTSPSTRRTRPRRTQVRAPTRKSPSTTRRWGQCMGWIMIQRLTTSMHASSCVLERESSMGATGWRIAWSTAPLLPLSPRSEHRPRAAPDSRRYASGRPMDRPGSRHYRLVFVYSSCIKDFLLASLTLPLQQCIGPGGNFEQEGRRAGGGCGFRAGGAAGKWPEDVRCAGVSAEFSGCYFATQLDGSTSASSRRSSLRCSPHYSGE